MQNTAATSRLGVWAKEPHRLRTLAATHRLDLCFGSVRQEDGGFALDAYLPTDRAMELAERLSSEGYRCTVTAAHEEEAPEVSTTNRYATEIPRGVGIKR